MSYEPPPELQILLDRCRDAESLTDLRDAIAATTDWLAAEAKECGYVSGAGNMLALAAVSESVDRQERSTKKTRKLFRDKNKE